MIARVFPRRTKATPDDDYAFIGDPPLILPPDIDAVHVSATFSWDLPEAERLVKAWAHVAPVLLGGPATGMRGEEFVPGMYLKTGYVITSRGCPNRCWFCSVWKRDGTPRELPIRDGWILQDDNLLACSEPHIRRAFAMLMRQREPAIFLGGLEAKRLEPWHVELLAELAANHRLQHAYFAYDTADDWEPLERAAKMLRAAGLIREHKDGDRYYFRAYLLAGWPKDTVEAATQRAEAVKALGITPLAMLYRSPKRQADNRDKHEADWAAFKKKYYYPRCVWGELPTPDKGELFKRGDE